MPYEHQWLIENQVIYARLWGKQTIEELLKSNDDITQLLDSAGNRLVHMIINDEDLKEAPTNIVEVRKALTYATHPNLCWIIMIGKQENTVWTTLKEFVITMLTKIARGRYVRFTRIEEAFEHLRNMDSTIDWAKLNASIQTQRHR